MVAGKIIEDEFGRFEDEVLNAGLLPPRPDWAEAQSGLRESHAEVHPDSRPGVDMDVDSYLSRVYSSQE